MARFSKVKPAFCAVLTTTLESIARLAVTASNVDREALTLAQRALTYAQAWTRDTTEGSRRRMFGETRELVRVLDGKTDKVSIALANYAEAMDAFEQSNYAAMQRHATTAQWWTRH